MGFFRQMASMFFLTPEEKEEKKIKNSCTLSHDWGKWHVTSRLEKSHRVYGNVTGEVLVQERVCKRCGFTELNKQKLEYTY